MKKIPIIDLKVVKELLTQINSHSSEICHKIVCLKSYSSKNRYEIRLREEIATHNECIQDILVSFHDLYLGDEN